MRKGEIINASPSKLVFVILVSMMLLSACDSAATETPPPAETATLVPSETATAAPTNTRTPTLAPTNTVIPTATPTSTIKPTTTRTLTPVRTKTPVPPTKTITPIPGPAQTCADLAAKGWDGVYAIYIQSVPDLVWDQTPRWFKVGVCDTMSPSKVPQGKYKIVFNFPDGGRGIAESSATQAELHPGFNEITVGPWIPGLENHRATCAMRATPEVQVMYNDTPDRFFRALVWPDGKDRTIMSIACGGNYP